MRLAVFALTCALGLLSGCDDGKDAGDTDGDTDPPSFLHDLDGDGVSDDEDCDDRDASVGGPVASWPDQDGDGYGSNATPEYDCVLPAGRAPNTYDCDDADATINPAAPEVCDGVDQDCDGEEDEDPTDAPSWYADADGDGWGDDAVVTTACEAPDGTVPDGGDCDDADPARNPAATEICDPDDVDEDCDELADDADGDADAASMSTWYRDADGDGHGGTLTTSACDAPEGYVATGDDCDDHDAAAHPGATEVCGPG
jgi:hypothetical protein